jgi:large subunit ribosomal protein L21
VPKQDGSPSAVVVSGGKQYRVAAGDRILVDRIQAEPGAEVALGRVLLLAGEDGVQVGTPALDGVTVAARVVAHRRGPKIDVLRYKSKKRVRVHRGARADLTALEILSVGAPAAQPEPEVEEASAEPAPARRRSARPRQAPKAAAKEEAGDGA